MRRGDVITAVEEIEIETTEQLQKAVEQNQVGQPLSISVRQEEKPSSYL